MLALKVDGNGNVMYCVGLLAPLLTYKLFASKTIDNELVLVKKLPIIGSYVDGLFEDLNQNSIEKSLVLPVNPGTISKLPLTYIEPGPTGVEVGVGVVVIVGVTVVVGVILGVGVLVDVTVGVTVVVVDGVILGVTVDVTVGVTVVVGVTVDVTVGVTVVVGVILGVGVVVVVGVGVGVVVEVGVGVVVVVGVGVGVKGYAPSSTNDTLVWNDSAI